MVEISNTHKKCNICKEEYTTIHTEIAPGEIIYVCDNCLEAAKHNFVFICMSCNQVYLRPKKQMIEKTDNFELKRAYMLCEDMQIIQGIDICIQCDPEGIIEHVTSHRIAMC